MCCSFYIYLHVYDFLLLIHIVKVGPLAAYYQVPLRHILLVTIFTPFCFWNLTTDSDVIKIILIVLHFIFRDSVHTGLWWDELTKWCYEASAKRRTWLSQWVCTLLLSLQHIVCSFHRVVIELKIVAHENYRLACCASSSFFCNAIYLQRQTDLSVFNKQQYPESYNVYILYNFCLWT